MLIILLIGKVFGSTKQTQGNVLTEGTQVDNAGEAQNNDSLDESDDEYISNDGMSVATEPNPEIGAAHARYLGQLNCREKVDIAIVTNNIEFLRAVIGNVKEINRLIRERRAISNITGLVYDNDSIYDMEAIESLKNYLHINAYLINKWYGMIDQKYAPCTFADTFSISFDEGIRFIEEIHRFLPRYSAEAKSILSNIFNKVHQGLFTVINLYPGMLRRNVVISQKNCLAEIEQCLRFVMC